MRAILYTLHRKAVQVSAPPLPSQSQQISHSSPGMNKTALFFFLGGIVVLAIMLILIWLFRKRIGSLWQKKMTSQVKTKRNKSCIEVAISCHSKFGQDTGSKDILSESLRSIMNFDFQTLKRATGNFNGGNFLGRGGFGPVYRGKLRDGRQIAVKKLSLEKSQQGESEFLSEVRMITSIQHKNLVRLLGCCSEGSQRLLVYEYMENGSLDQIIYGKNDPFLNWKTRFQIILGIARGLQYLHEDSHMRIIHRDIKASNILLDKKFQPKIGDFGLARFLPEGQNYLSTNFAGTLGYTAPEYALRGELSEKADIYSFGVLALEIISCRKNTDLTLPSEMQYLPDYAWKLYERSRLIDMVDPKLRQTGTMEKDVMLAINVAFLCLHPNPESRPRMSEVVAMLTCKVEMIGTPTKPAVGRRCKKNDDFSCDIMSDFPSPVPSESSSLHTITH